MRVRFLKNSDKKKLVSDLRETYGIDKINNILVETGKQKIRGFSGHMTREEIEEFSEIANIEIIGLYLFKKEFGGLRLSLDGAGVFKDKLDKNIFVIGDDQLENWMNGENLDVGDNNLKKGYHVIKNGNDFFGCGFFDGKKLINFVPKERRIRKS